MRVWPMQAIVLALTAMVCGEVSTSQPASQSAEINPTDVTMIFWEKQSWQANGPSARLTLHADGKSEIMVRQFGPSVTPAPGWRLERQGQWNTYRKDNPYPPEETRQKLKAALDAGILLLRSFPPGYEDGSGTLVGIEAGGRVKQTIIPMFIHPGEKDNQGSENEKRFRAVEKILGGFDADPTHSRGPGPH